MFLLVYIAVIVTLGSMVSERRVHPDCINASNPYHECVEYCFKKIAEAKARFEKQNAGLCSFSILSLPAIDVSIVYVVSRGI